jgi:hypothetical protein
MSQTVRFQETLRRLAMIDEAFVEGEAGLGLGLPGVSALDPRTVALLRLGVSVAIVASAVGVATALGYDITAALEEPG